MMKFVATLVLRALKVNFSPNKVIPQVYHVLHGLHPTVFVSINLIFGFLRKLSMKMLSLLRRSCAVSSHDRCDLIATGHLVTLPITKSRRRRQKSSGKIILLTWIRCRCKGKHAQRDQNIQVGKYSKTASLSRAADMAIPFEPISNRLVKMLKKDEE